MGGDDSQKLLPCRGSYSPPGRKPPAQLRINNVTETAGWNLARGTPSFWPGIRYRLPGSLLESRGGSILPRAEAGMRGAGRKDRATTVQGAIQQAVRRDRGGGLRECRRQSGGAAFPLAGDHGARDRP